MSTLKKHKISTKIKNIFIVFVIFMVCFFTFFITSKEQTVLFLDWNSPLFLVFFESTPQRYNSHFLLSIFLSLWISLKLIMLYFCITQLIIFYKNDYKKLTETPRIFCTILFFGCSFFTLIATLIVYLSNTHLNH